MADLDDLREGCNFGLGVASTNNANQQLINISLFAC